MSFVPAGHQRPGIESRVALLKNAGLEGGLAGHQLPAIATLDNWIVRPVYVSGHRDPDTDSIGSAIAYAELKSRLDPDTEYVPVRLGEPNPQTRWVLEQAGVAAPEFLPHIRLRAGDLMQTECP